MNNQPVYRKNQIQTLILLLKVLELKSHEDNFFELVLFLARYSFLFENPQDSVNSCTSEVPQIYTEQAFSDWSMKYTDPDGRIVRSANSSIMMTDSSNYLGTSNEKICDVGCVLTAYTRIAAAILGSNISVNDANEYATENNLFSNGNLLTIDAGVALINGLLEENGVTDTKVEFAGSFTSKNQDDLIAAISRTEKLKDEYFVNGRIETTNKDGTDKYGHHVNINHDSVFADTDNGCMNLSISDTNGVRKKLYHDSRSNTLQRFDLFKVIKTQPAGDN